MTFHTLQKKMNIHTYAKLHVLGDKLCVETTLPFMTEHQLTTAGNILLIFSLHTWNANLFSGPLSCQFAIRHNRAFSWFAGWSLLLGALSCCSFPSISKIIFFLVFFTNIVFSLVDAKISYFICIIEYIEFYILLKFWYGQWHKKSQIAIY